MNVSIITFLFCLELSKDLQFQGKLLVLLNLINHEQDIEKTFLYTRDPYEAKYQLLIKKRESTGLKYLNDSKAFIGYSNNMDDIYRNIE